VIINRGFLPRKLLDIHIAQQTKEEEGAVTILGVLRHGEQVRDAFLANANQR
jgi:cytochrome oxidase assembly protein ShyY1